MPVRDLKRLLESRSVSIAAVVEKSELVDLAIRSVASGVDGRARDGANATKTTPAKEGDDDVMIVLDDEDGGGGGIDRGTAAGSAARVRLFGVPSERRHRRVSSPSALPPGARFADVYDVVLLVDNREQFGSRGGQSRSEGRLEHVRQLSCAAASAPR